MVYFYPVKPTVSANHFPMKKFYTSLVPVLIALALWTQTGKAQCAGSTPGGATVYDTTVRFPSGVTHRQIKFPKFDATSGMLTCVKLIVTMTGIIDTTAFENLSDAAITVSRNYNRSDAMSGPGLTPSMTNNFNNVQYFLLSADNGVTNAGPDFYSGSRDTIMRQQMAFTLTDSTLISAFYGTDSLTYNYDINVVTNVTAGGDFYSYTRTSTYVNFRFEYCTCPLSALPVGLKNFSVTKTGAANAGLRWEAEAGSDNYFYEIEVSRDGYRFSKDGTMSKQVNAGSPSYQYGYAVKPNEYGRYYFRIKQQWLDGYYRYSEIRPVDFANPLAASVSVYPNPSSGRAGIKFVAAKAGVYGVQVSSAAGQTVSSSQMPVAETDFKQLSALQKGTYYVKITELSTGATCVQQLVVK